MEPLSHRMPKRKAVPKKNPGKLSPPGVGLRVGFVGVYSLTVFLRVFFPEKTPLIYVVLLIFQEFAR